MKKLIMYLVFLGISSISIAQQCPIIPLPNNFVKLSGEFLLNENTPIIVADRALEPQAHFLQQELLKKWGVTLSIQSKSTNPAIVLNRLTGKEKTPGQYRLQISPKEIKLSARSNEGVFYGLNSLLQLIKQSAGSKSFKVAGWDINDYPRYSWRGIMLDESRYFFGKETVKFILDWMAFYKLNRFHWHLTDDPGWRLEIKKYPKLTLVGGIGSYHDSLAPATYYTQEEIKEIVSYARDRFITVVPEIDMPGHAAGANKAYPEFSGGGSVKYPEFTFNPGKEGTYTYLSNILKETDALFPSEMIHLGGDEVHFGNEQWNHDANVQKLMKDRSLPDLKAVETYFIERMSDSVSKMNNKVLFWDEVAGSSIPAKNSIMFWWRHDRPEQLKLALNKGYPVVLTPRLPLYFDFVQDTTQRIGRRWKGEGFNQLQDVYHFSPSKLHQANQSHLILGMQGSIWTDRISTTDKLEYMMFPRIGALAEAAWTKDQNKNDFSGFSKRIEEHIDLYRRNGIYFYNPFSPKQNPEPLVPGFINP